LKNYFTHLKIQGKTPKVMHIDHRHEFVNNLLVDWLHSKGMEVHMTAPYSLSQNGVTECMNRTLEELARAMQLAANLPVFLWKHTIMHTVYVHNRAYSLAVKTATPYERWYSYKPDVTHLHKFSTLVWILLQGQKILLKMEAKSK